MLTCTQSDHGVASRGARADQVNGKPTCPLFCSAVLKVICFVAATVYSSTRTSSLCGPLLCECGHRLSCLVLCVLWYVCVCVGACGSVYLCPGTPQFSFFLFLLAAAALSCRLYHTVAHALKLPTLWQTRYNSSHTASLRGALRMRVLTKQMR